MTQYTPEMLRNLADLCQELGCIPTGVVETHGDRGDQVYIANPLAVYAFHGYKETCIGFVEGHGSGWFFRPKEG